jgi:hypothetical protein
VTRFQMPIEKPAEIIPRLGKQEKHWKVGRSAYELSTAWMSAGGIPAAVRSVLAKAPEWADATLLDGIFERETEIPGNGRPSQTDLLAIVGLASGNAILGVEGKVDEPFGPLVREWLSEDPSSNKVTRLSGLCSTLGVKPEVASDLRYQLFHRSCAAIYESKRFRYGRAMMLVHSFAPVDGVSGPAGYADFGTFASAVGMPVTGPGNVSPTKLCEGIEFRLAWVSDKPSTAP